MKKIYITSDGFLGSYLKNHFKNNLTNNIENADIVINTVGILKENKHTYEESHVEFVKNLIPKVNDKKLIHISALGSKKNHPSGYKHTKALAEELIKQNVKNYAIIKPSIILGEGQKLYEELEKFKNMPLIFAPKMKVQPITIEKLTAFIDRVIKDDLKGEFELCGEEVISMKKLFLAVFQRYGKNPIILEMPKAFFRIMLPFLSVAGIMSKDEYLMIEDNICKG
ncbi:MAG: complex I NDUFA9 subunit family protein [Epsilonproteobacteria bacterium]|nr:complex I NDUFA9 subunit family protein [Campylobacterota bacterium]